MLMRALNLSHGTCAFGETGGDVHELRACGHRGKDQTELRLLPPGSFNDYLSLLRARYPEEKLSLKLFTKVLKREILVGVVLGFVPNKHLVEV